MTGMCPDSACGASVFFSGLTMTGISCWNAEHNNVLRTLIWLSSLVWNALKLNPKCLLHLAYCGN